MATEWGLATKWVTTNLRIFSIWILFRMKIVLIFGDQSKYDSVMILTIQVYLMIWRFFWESKFALNWARKQKKTWLNANQRKHYQTFYIKCSWKGHKSQNSFCESDSGPHPTMFFKKRGKKSFFVLHELDFYEKYSWDY